MQHYKTICEMVDGDISAEVISTDFAGIVEEGKKLAALHPNIVVKVPMIRDGIKALKWLIPIHTIISVVILGIFLLNIFKVPNFKTYFSFSEESIKSIFIPKVI